MVVLKGLSELRRHERVHLEGVEVATPVFRGQRADIVQDGRQPVAYGVQGCGLSKGLLSLTTSSGT